MKVNMVKMAGGNLVPVDDISAEKLTKFKTGAVYPVEIKQPRNPLFHGKVFAFFNFCFEHWDGQACFEYLDHSAQFDEFRGELTVMAGYYIKVWHPFTGDLRLVPMSIAYGNMEQDEFEQLYSALIRTAIDKIFFDCDVNIENKLMSFF